MNMFLKDIKNSNSLEWLPIGEGLELLKSKGGVYVDLSGDTLKGLDDTVNLLDTLKQLEEALGKINLINIHSSVISVARILGMENLFANDQENEMKDAM